MRTATIFEIREELNTLSHSQLVSLCTGLARNKKENKEFITYYLFEAGDLRGFLDGIKSEIDLLMAEVSRANLYYAKKSIRKILRITNKHIRFTASKQAEAELLIHFCVSLKATGIHFENSVALDKLFKQQLKKIDQALSGLHEDLQYDYRKLLKTVS